MPNTVRAVLLSAADIVVQLANLAVGQDDPVAPEGHRWMRESGDINDITWAAGQEPVMGNQWDGNNPATFSVPVAESDLAAMSQAELAQEAGAVATRQAMIADELAARAE